MEYSKKVVSFCLYGEKRTYLIGMKENLILGKEYFKDWEIRIYHNDTVPQSYLNEYKELGGICIPCKNVGTNKLNWEGMFWRWYPIDDKTVHYWLSRDADSRLSLREFKIVNEWINSEKTLHSIRDHRCHFNYIMGGLFGINNKLFHERYKLKKVPDIIKDLSKTYKERPYNVDQIFLNEDLQKIIGKDIMAHISNCGRRIYDSDIEIPPSNPNFIGKQYRLTDNMPDLDINKGCYWRKLDSSKVYWSDSSILIKNNVTFKDVNHFYEHREKNGYPKNWSQILTLDGYDVEMIEDDKEDNNINKEETVTNKEETVTNKEEQLKGCYFKYKNGFDIFWSNSEKDIKKDLKFNNPNEYYNHREKNGYPKNWSQIKVIN